MMDILVVGGAGYIGSHCCKMLKSKGYNPVVLDNLTSGFRRLVKWGDFAEGDIRDRKLLRDLFGRYSIRAVMHFAAYCLVGESVVNPYKYYENNVCATLCLLDVMREFGISNFIFSSSAATYGNPLEAPIPESHVQNPINPYGRSKLMIEHILGDFDRAYGTRYVSLRYFNAAGADPDGETGEMHDPETHLIPLIFQTALGLREKLEVYGTDYPTPDGTCLRDYIHVMDLASAHILALEWLLDGKPSEMFNLGNERGFSVREIIEMAGRVSGRTIRVHEGPRRSGDPAELVASSSKIKATLGWRPQYGDIEDILTTAWRWHSKKRG
jgi:UDP-glucose 4-epimerase